jgi:hypothetical protein
VQAISNETLFASLGAPPREARSARSAMMCSIRPRMSAGSRPTTLKPPSTDRVSVIRRSSAAVDGAAHATAGVSARTVARAPRCAATRQVTEQNRLLDRSAVCRLPQWRQTLVSALRTSYRRWERFAEALRTESRLAAARQALEHNRASDGPMNGALQQRHRCQTRGSSPTGMLEPDAAALTWTASSIFR